VAVRRKGSIFKVRYYPTGVITDPGTRKELPGVFATREQAEVQAAILRERLIEHRLIHTPGGDLSGVLLSSAARRFVEQKQRESLENDLPVGTFRKIKSDIGLYVLAVTNRSDFRLKDLPGSRAEQLCKALSQAKKKDGHYKGENTISASQGTLGKFGDWLVKERYLPENPFTSLTDNAKERSVESKTRNRRNAVAQSKSESFTLEDDAEEGLGLDDVPSLAVVSALSDAMFRRESGKTSIHNSRLRPLDLGVARQLAAMPLFRTATGLRHCETLATHTSRIDLDRLTIGVDRQLVRIGGWGVSGQPELAPPKHNRKRVAHVWPMFAGRLRELVAWADDNTEGWLFAPPRKDGWWTENADKMWDRAIELMAREHAEALAGGHTKVPPLWTWKDHYTRHAYGSYSLAPRSSGGLGWSLRVVSKSMGHASERTTERIYRHAIADELLIVRQATIEWPELDG